MTKLKCSICKSRVKSKCTLNRSKTFNQNSTACFIYGKLFLKTISNVVEFNRFGNIYKYFSNLWDGAAEVPCLNWICT